MSRLPDNPSLKGERRWRVSGETVLTCFCCRTSQGLLCGCHGGQGHPILEPGELGVHIPSSTGVKGLASVSEFTCALLPGRRFPSSLPWCAERSQRRVTSILNLAAIVRGRADGYWKSLGLSLFLLNLCLRYPIRKLGCIYPQKSFVRSIMVKWHWR